MPGELHQKFRTFLETKFTFEKYEKDVKGKVNQFVYNISFRFLGYSYKTILTNPELRKKNIITEEQVKGIVADAIAVAEKAAHNGKYVTLLNVLSALSVFPE
jgi:hypothetical protein